ncbi:MAG: hypothetical protein ACKVTZ_02420 [Bacteroidia bacterium]
MKNENNYTEENAANASSPRDKQSFGKQQLFQDSPPFLGTLAIDSLREKGNFSTLASLIALIILILMVLMIVFQAPDSFTMGVIVILSLAAFLKNYMDNHVLERKTYPNFYLFLTQSRIFSEREEVNVNVFFKKMENIIFRLYDNAAEANSEDFYQTIEIKWESEGEKYAFYGYIDIENDNYENTLQLMKYLKKAGMEFKEYDTNYERTYFLKRDHDGTSSKKYEELIEQIGKEEED